MSKVCDLTGKRRQVGNKVSHANNKTLKRNEVNLKYKTIFDPETGKKIRLRVSARTIKTLDKVGSISKILAKNLKRSR